MALTYAQAVAQLNTDRQSMVRRAAWPAHRAAMNNFGSVSVNDVTGCGGAYAISAADVAGIDWAAETNAAHATALDAARAAGTWP